MEQDERAVADHLPEGNTEQGGEATAELLAGEVSGTAEDVDEELPVCRAASQSAKKHGLKEPSPESDEVVTAEESGRVEREDREACENSSAIAAPCFGELRAPAAAAADATPPSTSLRARSGDSKLQDVLMGLTAAGDAGPAGSEAAADLGAPSSSVPATATHVGVPAPVVEVGDHGAALRPACSAANRSNSSAPGTTKVAIAHAAPRDSYRRVPWRSRKQHSPKRFVAVAGAGAPPARDPSTPQAASLGSALPPASGTTEAALDDTASSYSTGRRPPSGGRRKQSRSAQFVAEDAGAAARAKARRSDIALDRFLSCLVRRCPASRSEWARNVTADDS